MVTPKFQRGPDHGLPRYYEARELYRVSRPKAFADVTTGASMRKALEVQKALESAYVSVDHVEASVGALPEGLKAGVEVGPFLFEAFKCQLSALRDGNRLSSARPSSSPAPSPTFPRSINFGYRRSSCRTLSCRLGCQGAAIRTATSRPKSSSCHSSTQHYASCNHSPSHDYSH
jgi:hypothetical protein